MKARTIFINKSKTYFMKSTTILIITEFNEQSSLSDFSYGYLLWCNININMKNLSIVFGTFFQDGVFHTSDPSFLFFTKLKRGWWESF